MNELNKLIEQYETENPGRVAYEGEIDGNCDFYKNFVLWLASRPTCGKEQRKFLDEVETGCKFSFVDMDKVINGE